MFVGKDVATALGYAKPQNALATHVDREDKSTAPIQGTAYETRVTLINESGLYSLILSSKLPQAKAFKRWVTSEVLPQIRRTGGYIVEAWMCSRSTICWKLMGIIVRCKTWSFGQGHFGQNQF